MSMWQEQIAQLSPPQKELLGWQILDYLGQKGSKLSDSQQELVAYLIADDSLDVSVLKSKLRAQLPAYMVPNSFVRLDAFPKLPNGKINAHALPAVQSQVDTRASPESTPETLLEKTLWEIWKEVLQLNQLGLDDNFFEIGGDSILSIQIVAKARKRGIRMAPNLMFEHQSIRELASVLSIETPAHKPESHEEVQESGEIGLLPIQAWFLKNFKNAPQYWNQVLHFERTQEFSEEHLEQSLQVLLRRHGALRSRFYQEESQWKVQLASPEDSLAFTRLEAEDDGLAMEQIAARAQADFNLQTGPLFRLVYVTQAKESRYHVLFLAHHLVMDRVSWGILETDFQEIYSQLSQGQALQLPPKTSPIGQWAQYLKAQLAPHIPQEEIAYWQKQISEIPAFPKDQTASKPYLEKNTQDISLKLSASDTHKLLKEVPQQYAIRVQELLLFALLNALAQWREFREICVNWEGHGREVAHSNLDLSETIGWFTNMYPQKFILTPQSSDPYFIKSLKEQSHQVWQQGMGFGALAFLREDQAHLSDYQPHLVFNYLGQETKQVNEVLGQKNMILEGSRHPDSERYHELELNALVQEGALHIRLTYSTEVLLEASVQALAKLYLQLIPELIQHCLDSPDEGYTPSDFPEANLNQDDLDNLLGQIN